MKTDLHFIKVAVAAIALSIQISASGQTKPLYENDFEKTEAGKVPEDMLVLDGQFGVKEENGNKVLELPGAPLDTFGVLFGPTESSNIIVSATVFGTGKGRRYPAFGVGANGVGGYRLQVSPGKKMLELFKRDELLASTAYEWKSAEWTRIKLQVNHVKAGEFKVEGKVWIKGTDEPKQPMISFSDAPPPSAGRSSIWGSPYSGTPVQFDDLRVERSEAK